MNLAAARLRLIVLAAVAIALGVVIARIDSSLGWDDTGITAFALAGSAGLVALLGLRFWLAAALVVLPIVAAYLPHPGVVHVLAPLVALMGAVAGAVMRRAFGKPAA
jgi:hypothetical protein